MPEQLSIIWIDHIFFLNYSSFVDEYLSCLHFRAIMNHAVMNIHVQDNIFNSPGLQVF